MANEHDTGPHQDKASQFYNGANIASEQAATAAAEAALFKQVIVRTQKGERFDPDKGPTPEQEVAALRAIREFAHGRGWALAAPDAFLPPADRTYFSNEDEDASEEGRDEGPRPLCLNVKDLPVMAGKIQVTPTEEELALIKPWGAVLRFLEEAYQPPPKDAPPFPNLTDGKTVARITMVENLLNPLGLLVGKVVRYDFKKQPKRYVAYFWRKNGWWAAREFPCDVRPFGPTSDTSKPVLLTEGPKAMHAAMALAQQKDMLGLALRQYDIFSWHGADQGVDHTDWNVFRERTVYCMSDDDEPGLENMLAVARAVSRAGGTPSILRFGKMRKKGGHDFADEDYVKRFKDWQECAEPMFRSQVEAFLPRKIVDDKPLPPRFRSVFLATWIWVPAAKGIFSNVTQEEYDYATFSSVFGNSAAKRLMGDDRRFQARGLVFLPGSPYGLQEDGLFNLAVPSPLRSLRPAETPDLPEAFARYLEGCIPDPIAREAVLDFEAHAIAYPNVQPGWASLYVGGPDAGKTSLARFFGGLPGRQVEAPVEAILGEFQTPDLMHAASVFVEELYDYTGGKGHAIYQRSKPFITSPERTMNIKGKPQFRIKNVVRLRCTSNQPNALLMEQDDRRWLIVDFQRSPHWSPTLFDDTRIAVYQALLCRGLKGKGTLPAQVPRTAAKEQMVADGLSPREDRIRSFVDSMVPGDCVLSDDIRTTFGVSDGVLRARLPGWEMTSLGQVFFPTRTVKRGERTVSYRPYASVWMKAGPSVTPIPSPEEIARRLRKVGAEGSDKYREVKATVASGTVDRPSDQGD